jgi:hypothetical protein
MNKSHSELELLRSSRFHRHYSQCRKVKRFFVSVLALFSALSFDFGTKAQAATPIMEYRFNETGIIAKSSCPIFSLTLRNASEAAIDLHGADGAGVSSLASDRAFNNTASSRMGKRDSSSNAGGIANQSDLNAIDKLASFTLRGWFKTLPGTTVGGFVSWRRRAIKIPISSDVCL